MGTIKWPKVSSAHNSEDSFSVTGTCFKDLHFPSSEVQVSLFVAGALFGEFWIGSRSAIFQKFLMALARKVASVAQRVAG